MASLIKSANQAGADIFTAVGTTARVFSRTMSSASNAVDTLELKSKELYDDTATAIATRRPITARKLIAETVLEHVTFLEETHKALYPNATFNREKAVTQTMKAVKESVEGKGTPSLTCDQIFPVAAE